MAAYAHAADGPAPLFCLVRDVSPTGAKLEFVGAATIPGIFDLHINGRSRVYRAEIIWRRAEEVGIRFLAKTATAGLPRLSRAS